MKTKGGPIHIEKEEVFQIIRKWKGGKAISMDCVPDRAISKQFILDTLKEDKGFKDMIDRR